MASPEVKSSPPHSDDSDDSSPEDLTAPYAPAAQKRKGGRKPVYATQEERKMRNRAAQAAFRERRTEYIKHLEATIKYHEETLATLQQSSRSAADEVLMLRYKNSLLERILLEKRIDVHAELKAFTQNDSPTAVPSLPPHPPHVQRALNQRRAFQHQFQAQMQRRQQQHQGVPPPSKRIKSASMDASFLKKPSPRVHVSLSAQNSPTVEDAETPISPMQIDNFILSGESSRNFLPQSNAFSSLSSLYAPTYQSHMDKLDQEYENDADIYDNEDLEELSMNMPPILQRSNYILGNNSSSSNNNNNNNHHHHGHHRNSSIASTIQSPTNMGPPGSAISNISEKGKESAGNTATSSSDEHNLQSFYNTGSWTVDLFSDPYLMGPLQFPNPFQTFPTSSMR